MNKLEFLQALETGLSGANPEERAAAIQYYTEYLDDAGPERAAEVIEELGGPDKVIADILGGPVQQPSQSWAPPTQPQSGQASGQPFGMPPPPQAPNAPPQWAQAEAPPFGGAQQPPNNMPYPPPQGGYQQSGYAQGRYNQRNNNIAKIILIVLACLFLFPLFGGVGGALIGLTVAVLCLFLVPIFAGVGFLAGGVVTIIAGATLIPAFLGSGLLTLGIGIVLVGLSLLLFYAGGRLVGRVFPTLVRGFVSLMQSIWGKIKSIGGSQGGNHG